VQQSAWVGPEQEEPALGEQGPPEQEGLVKEELWQEELVLLTILKLTVWVLLEALRD